MKVLITGITGAHAQLVALRLVENGHEVLGIDVRPWQGAPRGVKMFQTDVRKRPAADVFRVHRPDVVIHMATITHFDAGSEQRFRVNLRGTQAVFKYCDEFGVKEAVFVGRHTIYGAAETMANHVKAATDGNFEIQVFAAGEIVGGLEAKNAAADGTVRQHWETSGDGGATWATAFDGLYRPLAADGEVR